MIRILLIVLMSFSSLAIAGQSDIFKDFTVDMYEDSSATLSFKQIKVIASLFRQLATNTPPILLVFLPVFCVVEIVT